MAGLAFGDLAAGGEERGELGVDHRLAADALGQALGEPAARNALGDPQASSSSGSAEGVVRRPTDALRHKRPKAVNLGFHGGVARCGPGPDQS